MSEKKQNIVLLTASIDPAASNTPLTQITNAQVRLDQYIRNINRLIESRAFDVIIFCENTNYVFDHTALLEKAGNNKVEIEFLRFTGNYSKVSELGKGYGEGEIIKYAIENSKYLKENAVFYKLTGRIFITNIKQIVRMDQQKDVIFIKAQRTASVIDARFFKTSVTFFKEHLISVFTEVNDHQKNYLEMVYFKKLSKVDGIQKFSEFPKFTGLSGSTGEKYDQSAYEYLKYSLLLRFGFLNIKK